MKLFNIDKLVENLTGYIETKIELVQLDVKEELIQIVAKALAYSIISLFGILALVFISLGLGALLNDYLQSSYQGYLILGLFYLILAGIFFGIRGAVITRIKNESNEVSKETDV